MWFFTKKQTFEARENAGKRGKTRVTKSWLVFLLHLIGLAGEWREFFGPIIEQIKAKSREILDYFRHSIENGFDIQILQTYVYKSLCGRR